MVDYTQYKVNELKELLHKRNLPLSGTKSELIKCLKENDVANAAEQSETKAQETKEESKSLREEPSKVASKKEPEANKEALEESENEPNADVVAETSDATPSQGTVEESSKPELTDEEFFSRFTDDLEKQIKRAKRFGSDSSELEARLKRVQKFGISAVRDAALKVNNAQKRRSSHSNGSKKLKRGLGSATA